MEKRKLKPLLGVKSIITKEYKHYGLDPEWVEAIGEPERNFKLFVHGDSGQGKTTYIMKLCKHLAQFGKVYYNSVEQGDSKTVQAVYKSVGLDELPDGKFMLADESFDDMLYRLTETGFSPRFIVIDSVSKIHLTTKQYYQLIEALKKKKKAFIFIGRGKNPKRPDGSHAKYIQFDSDIKVFVSNGIAKADSRYGDTKPYHIFGKESKKKPVENLSLFS